MRFEREFWHAGVQFDPNSEVAPLELSVLLQRFVEAGNTVGEMQWHLPIMSGSVEVKLQIDVGGQSVTSVQPDLIVGSSKDGWQVNLSAARLSIRQQVTVANGTRGVASGQLVSDVAFGNFAKGLIDALPISLRARRKELAASYAVFTGREYPPAVIGKLLRGQEDRGLERPPRNGIAYPMVNAELEFQEIGGRRFVWNDTIRTGNWFDESGLLVADAGVVLSTNLRTAAFEPDYPQQRADSFDGLPTLEKDELAAFFGGETSGGIATVHRRIAARLPEGMDIDV
jgi:hypothetical protein